MGDGDAAAAADADTDATAAAAARTAAGTNTGDAPRCNGDGSTVPPCGAGDAATRAPIVGDASGWPMAAVAALAFAVVAVAVAVVGDASGGGTLTAMTTPVLEVSHWGSNTTTTLVAPGIVTTVVVDL